MPKTGARTARPVQTVRRPAIPKAAASLLDGEEDKESFVKRNAPGLIVGTIVLLGVGWVLFGKSSGPSAPERKAPEPQMVRLVLPPPPPPPPKLQPAPPKETKPNDQAPMEKPAEKPAEEKPKPVDKPPEGLGTSIKGPGSGMAGLGSGRGNGVIGGTGTGPGGNGGNQGAWYAGQVQSKVADAMRNHPKTRKASISSLKFSVTVDGSGRITGARLMDSTGDPQVDRAIQNEILTGLQLREPPPGGKPMTITMRLSAQRPN